MLFFIFWIKSLSIDYQDFNIQSPIFQSNINEIGVWALRGSAINMKKFIRLTSLLTYDYGGLCSIQKTYSNDWQIDFNFSFLINNHYLNSTNSLKESSITISYTNELCPESVLLWNGFKFIINITSPFPAYEQKEDNQMNLTFLILTNDGTLVGFSNYRQIKSVPLRLSGKQNFFAIRINKTNDNVTFFYLNDTSNCNEIYSMKTNITSGYFSLLNQVSNSDNRRAFSKNRIEFLNDLNSIKFNEKSHHEVNRSEIDHNRRTLSRDSISHSFSKQNRKKMMEKASFYKEEMDFNEGKLNAREREEDDNDDDDQTNNNQNESKKYNQEKLRDSFIEINEMIKRADQDLTAEDLQLFIDHILNVRLNAALSKFEKISNDLVDLRLDLIQTWSNVKNQLREISVSIHVSFAEIQNEIEKSVLLYLQQMKKNDDIKITIDLNRGMILRAMFVIFTFEFAGFVIFFCVKRKKTHNWKKID